jgi:16S rRNA (guanine(1405)-N(7))-methyltransferase
MTSEEVLDRLVSAVRSGAKYRQVCPEVVRNIGRRELATRGSLKEAVKATRNKLHQVGAAYMPQRATYEQWIAELRHAALQGDPDLRAACLRVMAHHASTRERLPILETFYAIVLADLGPIHSVLDVACGFNPLTLPWMALPREATYHACDIYLDLAAFLSAFLQIVGRPATAVACNVLSNLPQDPVDVALLLKALPCLEQLERGSGARLMDGIATRHLVVSFPVASLGGRDRHMAENYEARLRELVAGKGWDMRRFAFRTELAFLVTKPSFQR